MVVTSLAAADTASAVLALSKAAWRLGSSLSKLDQDTKLVDNTVKNLAGEVKSLGNGCDLVYAELEEIINQSEIGVFLPNELDDRMWNCLVTQMEDTSRTMQELELIVKGVRGEDSDYSSQVQRQRKLDSSKDQIVTVQTKFCRQNDNLQTTLLVINTVLTHIAPCRADQALLKKLDKLQNMAEKLQRSSEANQQPEASHIEATLIQCADEVIMQGTAMYEANLIGESVDGGQRDADNNIRVAKWMNTLEIIRWDERRSNASDMISNAPSIFSRDEAHTVMTSVSSPKCAVHGSEVVDAIGDDFEDDLDVDLVKAALETGTKAFEAEEWEEADSLLQEALRVLQQLPKQQRSFCDVFDLHYKLAVCAYQTQEPADSEEALVSLVQQSASSDEQRKCIYDAAHLLSQVYVRMGQVDRARAECEKALQARRRLLGKQSDASFESTALLAHIYVLLNNRARAKSCLAMIPEARRGAVLKVVEASLAPKMKYAESSSILNRSISGASDLGIRPLQCKISAPSPTLPMESPLYGSASSMVPQSPATSLLSKTTCSEDLHSITVTSLPSTEEIIESRGTETEEGGERHSVYPEPLSTPDLSQGEPSEGAKSFEGKALSRNEIMNRIGCQPKDGLEDAVCNGDYSSVSNLLNNRKSIWRSKLRKRGRPERVTALHFAALFGEIDIARRLIISNFNVSEVPYGYTTDLTPLKFAIGARQVEMVEFLIANGAKPSGPDTWSTLAGQLMNRSWLRKTMSEAEKEHIPHQIIAILKILLKHGWDINAPFETSGRTLLHQAVAFWTGSYMWDLELRRAVTSFLCDRGADPLRPDTEGQTPYGIASASGHQELLLALSQGLKKKEVGNSPVELFELSSEPDRLVKLSELSSEPSGVI